MANSQQSQESLSVEWLKEAQQLIEAENYPILEAKLPAALDYGLFSDATLNTARALRLNATVIYLATLGDANLPKPNDRAAWLAIYQTLAGKKATPEFSSLPDALPLKQVILGAISQEKDFVLNLADAKATLTDWQQAIEQAYDLERYDLLRQVVQQLTTTKVSTVDWLNICNALYKRQQITAPNTNNLDWAHSLFTIAQQLPDDRNCRPARSLFALMAIQIFPMQGDYEAALQAHSLITEFNDQLNAYIPVAIAYSHTKQYDKAITALDNWLAYKTSDEQVEATRTEMERVRKNLATQKAQTPSFDNAGAKALVAFQNIMNQHGIKTVLQGGALLGLIRDGQLLPHDDDLDLAVMSWQDQYAIYDALQGHQDFYTRAKDLKEEDTYHLKIYHIPTKVQIDTFATYQEGDKAIHGIVSDFGYVLKRRFSAFQPKATEFLGTTVYIPNNPELNLEENYGPDWQTPDTVGGGIVSIPDIVDEGGIIHQLACRHYAWMCIRDGKIEQLDRIVKTMGNYKDKAFGLSNNATLAFKKLCF